MPKVCAERSFRISCINLVISAYAVDKIVTVNLDFHKGPVCMKEFFKNSEPFCVNFR